MRIKGLILDLYPERYQFGSSFSVFNQFSQNEPFFFLLYFSFDSDFKQYNL